jgi:membrane protein implicated in regulation of membrane protease activity
MQAWYLVAFIVGLVLNIYFIIRGAERWRKSDVARRLDAFGRERSLGSISLRVPVAAAFTTTFGLVGYLASRYGGWSAWPSLALAVAVAGVAVTSAILVVKKWAVADALKDTPDERYVLQGQLATVTRAIPAGGAGEVSYIIDDRRFSIPAQAIDGTGLAVGVDVVVERVEDGVVYVEEWALVEQRL